MAICASYSQLVYAGRPVAFQDTGAAAFGLNLHPELDPTACPQYVMLTSADANVVTSSFDYAYAGGVWALAFTSVVGLHFASQGIGRVLDLIRRG